MKFAKVDLRLSEVPGRTCLTFWISGCTNSCKGCHSEWLQEDVGYEFTPPVVKKYVDKYKGLFDTILFMGGDNQPQTLFSLSMLLRSIGYSTAWYSGSDYIAEAETRFDYYKFGPYIEEKGPLTSCTSNQIMIDCSTGATMNHLFWR